MQIQIKHRWNGTILFEGDFNCLASALTEAVSGDAYLRGAYLRGAYLRGANLGGANLSDAYLGDANLRGANLGGANLGDANLSGANLGDANLRGANLGGANLSDAYLGDANLRGAYLGDATGINKYLTTDLYMLRDQPGAIRAYKLVQANREGNYARGNGHTPIIYEIGGFYEVDHANTDEQRDCGAGISLCSLPWAIKEWREGYRIFLAEHFAEDIAAIPIGSDGKYRVHRCQIVGEKDLAELGLVPQ